MNYGRWLPRISLRILLLLVAVLCVCLAFWCPAERDVSVRHAIVDYLERPTRDQALSAARKLAKDKQPPLEVRKVAVEILSAWDSFVDVELLQSFAQ